MKTGLPPGTPIYTGKTNNVSTEIKLWVYNMQQVLQFSCKDWQSCQANLQQDGIKWIEVNGIHDVKLVEEICTTFNLHALTIEDIVNVFQRSKLEEFDAYLYLSMRMFDRNEDGLISENLSLILLDCKTVISFQEANGIDCLSPIRNRILLGKGRIRKMESDYLIYALMDTVVDGYFDVLDNLGDKLEAIEAKILEKPHQNYLFQLHEVKRDLLEIRKAVIPLREVVRNMKESSELLAGDKMDVFFSDLLDHTLRIHDTIESYRELIASLMDLYLSTLSMKMNEVMKVLAVISSIFIPVTFIAGVYGMNFDNMPELHTKSGYFWTMGLMFLLIVGQIAYFKWRKWF